MTEKLTPEEQATLARMQQELVQEQQKPASARAESMPENKTKFLIGVTLSKQEAKIE